MKEYRPGSLADKIAIGLRAGKDYEQLRKELNLVNNVSFYTVRKQIGMGAGSKPVKPKSPKAEKWAESKKAWRLKQKAKKAAKREVSAKITRIEAIFHSDSGEHFRVLCAPKDFIGLYGHIIGEAK